MAARQAEIRIIWLMSLLVMGLGAWFAFEAHILSLICGLAFVMSVMQYANHIEHRANHIQRQSAQNLSRIPLYTASVIAILGVFFGWDWLFGLGLSAWIYFFLRWLRHLEVRMSSIEQHLSASPVSTVNDQTPIPAHLQESEANVHNTVVDAVRQWLFLGNPVLKGAIVLLVFGMILLLRFATEHWQLSLLFKLGLVALVGLGLCALGGVLHAKNRSFSLALEGLGLAILFLDVFFAYYNQLFYGFWWACILFLVIMSSTIFLSLKQKSIELALMAMTVAYLAPFTLPMRDATAIELLAYYLVINLAISVLTTLKPWKILNQIAFLVTLCVGGIYTFIYIQPQQQLNIAILVVLHSLVFIWLAFRFSQLLAKDDFKQFQLKPILDLGLLFGVPLCAYAGLYLLYFKEMYIQAAYSFAYAAVYALLYIFAIAKQQWSWIAQSYFSLSLIFLSFIPAILLPDQWSMLGWSVVGCLIYSVALYRESIINRYVGMAILSVAAWVGAYYFIELGRFSDTVYWVVAASYVLSVWIANWREEFRQQLNHFDIGFLSILFLVASILLQALVLDHLDGILQSSLMLLCMCGLYFISNEVLLRRNAAWTWLIPKWIGGISILVYALWLVLVRSHDGQIIWKSGVEHGLFAGALLLFSWVCIHPLYYVREEKEYVSLFSFASLSLASLSFIPSMPYISVVILPLVFALWSYRQKNDWQIFWQARSTLALMLVWMISSQLYAQHVFNFYYLPLLNPFDIVSIAMLVGFIWMLTQQQKSGLEQGFLGLSSVLTVLWLSSYILLRALHVYAHTPYNQIELWENATVQLSLTLLWVSLALVVMFFASRKYLKWVWLLGGSILVLVSLKLIIFDLAQSDTLTRVMSFLVAGMMMLIIAYIAPMPEDK